MRGRCGRSLPLPPLPHAVGGEDPEERFGAIAAPEMPERIGREAALRAGGYRLRLEPTSGGDETLVGTLRVWPDAGGRLRASGDLYAAAAEGAEADAAAELPVYPRSRHREYLRVARLARDGGGDGIELTAETHRLGADGGWSRHRTLSGTLRCEEPSSRWAGDLRDATGAPAGRLVVEGAGPWLRRAVVEIDRERTATAPHGDGTGRGWREVFAEVGWRIDAVEDDAGVPPPPAGAWSDAEVHAAMLAWRRHADHDVEWRFHVLCVGRLASTDRGLMYDAFASDSNNVPREGLALASDWVYPDEEPWGRVRGMRFGDEPRTYFRTAVHELGHAMGLLHNPADDGYMTTTTAIARRAAPGTFPDDLRWHFADDDALRLAHLPDPCVRPGGLPFVGAGAAEVSDADPAPPGLALAAAPVVARFPLAAPVRVELALAHRGGEPLLAPCRPSLMGGHVRGRAIGPDGVARRFLPLVRCTDDDELAPLAAGEERRHGLALLRGPDGALFPLPGDYRLEIELRWTLDRRRVRLDAATTVTVDPPPDAASAAAAREVLAAPDLLLAVALGGDHLPEGRRALARALADPVLRPHYAAVEARRLAGRDAPGDRERAAALCGEAPVAAASERAKLERLLT